MDHEGYHYKCTKTTRDGKRYYVCATSLAYCKSTAIKFQDGTVIIKKPHTHDRNDNGVLKKQFRDILVERAKLETIPLKAIYDEESIRNPNAAVLYTWPTAESSMRQARRQYLPPLPTTLRELGEYLDLNINKYQCSNQPFYQEWIVDGNGNFSVMFACQQLIDEVVNQGATELHADGTFKVVPSTPNCRQLFIIHLILQNHSIPICFILMETKTEVAYRKVLGQFKTKFPNVRPTSVMIDFETGLHNAFHQTYPEAAIFSCWFHFVQALQKNIKKLGYTNYVKDNMAAKMCIRMTAALALLPSHEIERGFEDIKTYGQANNVQLPRFFTYFYSFWIIRKGPESFSVHGQPRRTNNNVESFHSSLKQTFQVQHPNLWTFLNHLNNMVNKQHAIVGQLARGLQPTRCTKFKYILNSVRIKNSTALLGTGAITVKEFLIQCSHTTEHYLERELNWENEAQSSEEEIEDIQINQPIVVPAVEDDVIDPPPPIANPINQNAEINIEPEINIIEDYNDADFIIPEDEEMGIWQNFASDDEEEITFVQVPENLHELYPQRNEDTICVVCRMAPRTHALIPCGHKVLCIDCILQLQTLRCPICNVEFVNYLRVW